MRNFFLLFLAFFLPLLVGCGKNNGDNNSLSNKQEKMILKMEIKLIVAEPPRCEEKLVSSEPNKELVISTVKNLKWADITFVILKKSEKDWVELSGNLNPADGLSMRCYDDKGEHVSDGPPESLEYGTKILCAYLDGKTIWKSMIKWD